MATFPKESDFDATVIHELRQPGWSDADVIKQPSEADLLASWKLTLSDDSRRRLGNPTTWLM